MKLFVAIYGDCEILPWFIEHYENQGVTEFHCVVNEQNCPGIARRVEHLSGGKMNVGTIVDEEFVAKSLHGSHLNALKDRLVNPGEWCLKVDLDEFVEFEMPLPELIHAANNEACNCVVGFFLDRVAADGTFPQLDYAKTLDEQFPLGGYFTGKLLRGRTRKVIASIGSECKIRGGQHSVPNERVYSEGSVVHHFKWRAGVIERVRHRLTILRSRNFKYWPESQRLLDHVAANDGRIDVKDADFGFVPTRTGYHLK